MFRRSFLVFILLLFAFAVWAGDKPSADAIVAKADDAARRDSSFAAITMRIQTPRWNRELSMKAWTQGRDKSFIVVEKPAKDAGTTFLKLDHEMWQYIPRIERKVKIPPSMMLQSWMGSDFTNEDLSRDDAMITDYTHQVAGEETVDGLGVWLVESTPKESAAVFWGKVVSAIEKDAAIFRRQEFYDEDMKLAKVMTFDEIKMIGGRRTPTRMTMDNKKKTDHQTVLVFDQLDFNINIPESTFTQRHLTSQGR